MFVRIGLSIGAHFPGYVDAYFGPPSIAQSVANEGAPSLGELQALVRDLANDVASDAHLDSNRRDYLLSEITAMRTTLVILQGETPDIAEEVLSLYGVTPSWTDERTFTEAHNALASILPGSEPLPTRVHDFREKMRVSAQVAAPIISRLGNDLRERARAKFPLPASESCEFTIVRDKPWRAYNWYLGRNTSRIEFNSDHPIYISELPYTVAHESYPGHHTEHAIKEETLYRTQGRLEHSILLNNTPSTLVSEGIAMAALGIVTDPEEVIAIYSDLLAAAGLAVSEARRIRDFEMACRPLDKVQGNVLLLLHGEKAPDEDAIAYAVRHALIEEDLAKKYMQFFKDPLWRSYGFNYAIGHDLVESYLSAAPDRLRAFSLLLSEPVSPGHLPLLLET
jgi:hypothetical protein